MRTGLEADDLKFASEIWKLERECCIELRAEDFVGHHDHVRALQDIIEDWTMQEVAVDEVDHPSMQTSRAHRALNS